MWGVIQFGGMLGGGRSENERIRKDGDRPVPDDTMQLASSYAVGDGQSSSVLLGLPLHPSLSSEQNA